MAPGANPQNTSNTLHAPFPRTTATSRPLNSTSAANANRRLATTGSTNAPNPRPSGRGMVSSMGPPPAGGAGRRNERFDRLFYTSPLPRSISREYNNLRASHGTATGGATQTTVTTSTATATTTTNPTATRTTATTTTTSTVPSTLRRAINVNETGSAGAGIAKPSHVQPSPRNVALARLNGSKASSKAKVAAAVVDSDDPLSAPNASSISLSSPSQTITRHTNPSPRAPPITTKSPAPTKTRLVEDESTDMDSNSDDEAQSEAQDVDGNNKETTSEEEQQKKTASPLRAKRARSPPRAPILPKKLLKTGATVSPGGVRGMRSARKPAQVPLVQENEAAPQRSLPQNNHNYLDTKPPQSPSPIMATSPQSPHVAPAPAKKKAYKKILPGFYVPPGILDKTGSLWDGERRVSRRISLPPNYSTLVVPSQRARKTTGGRKSLGVGDTRVEKTSNRENRPEDDSESPTSTAVEPTPEQQNRPEYEEPESFPDMEQWESLSDEYIPPSSSAPPPPPQRSLPQQHGIRKLRKSLGGKAKRYTANTESESDVVVPGIIGGRIRRRSLLGTSVLDPTTTTVTMKDGGSNGRVKESRKETGNIKSTGRRPRERGTPSSWKLQRLRILRSLHGGSGDAADEGGMNRVLSAGIEESDVTTKTPVTTKKPAKTPAPKKGEDWVVEETPPQAPTTTTSAPATTVAKGKSTSKKGKKGTSWAVDETPQPVIERRVTRGSVSTGKKKSTRVGVGLTRGFNAEFEFSDDE